MKLNIAICDDVKAIREQINELIEKENPGVCPEHYETGDSLLAAGKQFDIVFLDIQMDGTDGTETAKKLRERDKDTILIFITAIQEYVFKAFDVKLWVLQSQLMCRTSWRRGVFWSKAGYVRTYHKGAWAALNDRGAASKIFGCQCT